MKKVNGKIISTSLAVAMMLTMPGTTAMASEFQSGESEVAAAFSDIANTESDQNVAVQEDVPVVEDGDALSATVTNLNSCTIRFKHEGDKRHTTSCTYDGKKTFFDGVWDQYGFPVKNNCYDVTSTPVTIQNAGTYKITVTARKYSGYTGSVTGTYTVNKADSTLKINDELTKDYDGQPLNDPSDFSITGTSKKADRGSWYDVTDPENPLTEAPVNHGNYFYKVTVSGDDNYNGATGSKEFSINTAENSWNRKLSMSSARWTYKETAGTPSAESTFGTVQYQYYDADQNPISAEEVKNAGNYYVKAFVPAEEEHGNYYALESDFVPFTIEKAQNTVYFDKDSLDMVYTGNKIADPDIHQTATGDDAVTPEYKWQQLKKGQWVDLQEAPEHAGHYKVIVTLPENTNYLSATAEKEFDITQATNKWTKSLSMTGWVYGEQANDPVVAAKFGNVKITYSRFKDKDFVAAKPTAGGKWYVKAEVAETADYTGLTSKVVDFYITNSDVLKYFTIDAKAGKNGTISPTGNAIVKEQSSWTYTITPNEGYEVEKVLVDGKNVGKVTSYTFSKVDSDHTIEVSFKEIVKEDTKSDVSVDENGNITLPGSDLNSTADDIKISTGNNGSRPKYLENEKTVLTADGSVISRPGLPDITAKEGWKVSFDGTVTDTDGNVYKTDGKVYGTDGSIKNSDGTYAQPAKAMIESVTAVNNSIKVVLSDECAGATGYDYVIATEEDYKNGRVDVSKNILKTNTNFYYVPEGTYYVYCHAWKRGEDGKKVFGAWSEVKKVTVTATTPSTPVIENVEVDGDTVTVTYTASENATGYDAILGKAIMKANGENRPVEYGNLVVKNIKADVYTATFYNVPAGKYYAGVHSFNKTSGNGSKVFSKWGYQEEEIEVK